MKCLAQSLVIISAQYHSYEEHRLLWSWKENSWSKLQWFLQEKMVSSVSVLFPPLSSLGSWDLIIGNVLGSSPPVFMPVCAHIPYTWVGTCTLSHTQTPHIPHGFLPWDLSICLTFFVLETCLVSALLAKIRTEQRLISTNNQCLLDDTGLMVML